MPEDVKGRKLVKAGRVCRSAVRPGQYQTGEVDTFGHAVRPDSWLERADDGRGADRCGRLGLFRRIEPARNGASPERDEMGISQRTRR
jgi:hypothetical protein